MWLLASNTDTLSIVTSTASAVDVQVVAIDMNTSTEVVGGYRKNTAITTATTTQICESPLSGVLRNVKQLSVRNKGADTQVVTILHTDGSTQVEIIEATLAPDTSLQYNESAGFWVTDTQGRVITSSQNNAGSPVVDSPVIVRLIADVTNNNATANTMQDVTGLSFPVTAGKLYTFEFNIVYTAAATTTGSRWGLQGPTFTYLAFTSEYSLTSTTTTRNAVVQAYDSPAASNATSGSTGNNLARINGIILPSASGTVIARFASEIASSAIVAKAESYLIYRQITP